MAGGQGDVILGGYYIPLTPLEGGIKIILTSEIKHLTSEMKKDA